MSEDTESPDPEQLRDILSDPNRAFLSAEGLIFLGEELKEFSAPRQIAAQALGNRLLSGRVTREQDGMYDGMYADAVCAIYLCRCPKSDVLLAVRRPEKVLEKAMDWAQESQILLGTPAFEEACEAYGRIFEALEASQFRIKEARQGASKNE
jgi:hypothetical protein